MKKLSLTLAVFALVFMVISCNNATKNETTSENTDVENVVEDVPEVLVPAKLTPDKVNLEEAIPIDELDEVVFAWNSVTEVCITGYCDFFFDEDDIGDNVSLLKYIDSDEVVIECEMIESYDERFSKDIPVTIKGELTDERFGRMQMINCELVEKGTELAATGEYVDPFVYDGENIAVADLYDSFYGWMDTEVAIIGYYKSTTKSTTDYGVTVRLDLSGETKEAGCRLVEGTEAPEITEREGVIIKGIIKGDFFGDVLLEECEVMNR